MRECSAGSSDDSCSSFRQRVPDSTRSLCRSKRRALVPATCRWRRAHVSWHVIGHGARPQWFAGVVIRLQPLTRPTVSTGCSQHDLSATPPVGVHDQVHCLDRQRGQQAEALQVCQAGSVVRLHRAGGQRGELGHPRGARALPPGAGLLVGSLQAGSKLLCCLQTWEADRLSLWAAGKCKADLGRCPGQQTALLRAQGGRQALSASGLSCRYEAGSGPCCRCPAADTWQAMWASGCERHMAAAVHLRLLLVRFARD